MSAIIEKTEARGDSNSAVRKPSARGNAAFQALDVHSARKTLILCPIGRGNLHLLALKFAIRSLGDITGNFSQTHEWDPDKQPKSIGLKLMQKLRAEKYDYSISLFPSGNWKFMAFAAAINAKKIDRLRLSER